MKKTFDGTSITNELKGASLYFSLENERKSRKHRSRQLKPCRNYLQGYRYPRTGTPDRCPPSPTSWYNASRLMSFRISIESSSRLPKTNAVKDYPGA